MNFNMGFAKLFFYYAQSRSVVERTHYTVWIDGGSLAAQKATFEVVPWIP
jgi:hypothetical protein